tara:strand:+ start:155 stop:604 length:450 start_codon:yes stop_codon:yes gene_type:complete
MAKFVKIHIVNATAPGSGGDWGGRDVLIPVSDIENIADNTAAGVYTAIITLKSGITGVAPAGYIAGDLASTVAGRICTLTVSTSQTAATNPTAVTVDGNMPSQAIVKALTANPGGVAATAQLALDGAGVRGTAIQMYWSSAVFSTDNTL